LPLDDNASSPPQRDMAESLRGQAAACRRLSLKSKTRAGTKALNELGDHFDDQASKLDPTSLRR
jgi:hypothetical protein